jgi:DnaJ-class molecular chaperone
MREYHPDANNGQNKYQDDSFGDLQSSYKLLLRLNG